MKNKMIFFLGIWLTLFLSTREGYSTTYAYLIGTNGSVVKINADADLILSNLKLEKSPYVQSGETSVIADRVNNHLFVVTGRLTPYIYVYDLKTLKFKKDLGIMSGDPDVNILVSPNGKQLFINWFDKEKEGWVYDLYDAKGLSIIKRFNVGEFVWGQMTTFSPDGGKIYIYNGEENTIQIYETTNFSLLDTIDLNTIWRTEGFVSEIEDFTNEKILIRETKKISKSSTPEITYFVYNIKSKTSSVRISTIYAGDTRLHPDGSRVFIHDEDYIEDERYYMSSGHLYVYDVVTGRKLGIVQFTVDKWSDILGIHPNGNKVYMDGVIQGVRSLIVIDVVNFKVLKTLKITDDILFMIFYADN